MRRHAPAILAVLTVSAPAIAGAAEDELVIAVEPGYAGVTAEDTDQHGFGGAGSVWLGLSDELWLAGSVGAGHARGGEMKDPTTFFEVFGGLTVALDVFRTIPFLEAQIGMVATDDSLSPTFRVGLGADYFVTRTISLGLVGRIRPTDDAIGGSVLTVAGRLAIRLEL